MAKIVNIDREIFTFEEESTAKQANPIQYYVNENGCHICESHALDKDDYGRVYRNGKDRRMSRYVWETYNGEKIPEGLYILHSCDNPQCINPNHLRPGTQAENMADMRRRGRMRNGSKHGRAKLTEQDVYFIKFESAGLTRKELAGMFKTSVDHVRDIMKERSWKHITKDMTEYSMTNRASA